MKNSVYSGLIALSLIGLTACGPSPYKGGKKPPVEQTVVRDSSGKPFLFTLAHIQERIGEYDKKLNRWREIDAASADQTLSPAQTEQILTCFRKLQEIRNGYIGLQNILISGSRPSAADNASAATLNQKDLSFVDSSCGRMLSDEKNQTTSWNGGLGNLSEIENAIANYSTARDYENVIQTWQNTSTNQRSRLSTHTKIFYAEALTYLRQEKKSIDVYRDVIEEMTLSGQDTSYTPLHQRIADLYLVTGNNGEARRYYQDILDTFSTRSELGRWAKGQLAILSRSNSSDYDAYSDLLRDYLSYVPAQDGYKVDIEAKNFLRNYPSSPVTRNVRTIQSKVKQLADQWYQSIWRTVDTYTANGQYDEAMSYLQELPTGLFDTKQTTAISKKIDELVVAGAMNQETQKMAEIQGLQEQWDNAAMLVTAERYDEALDVFKELRDTEYGDRARSKIDEVNLIAAKAERRRAADAFIASTKTEDFAERKKLLIESRSILKKILVSYPHPDMSSKVQRNIDRVEQEMENLDPQILMDLKASE